MTRWTEFIKEFARKNNVSYGCAMSDPKLREEYYKKYPKQTKEQKKEEDDKALLRVLRNSTIAFRNNYVRPYLKDKDGTLRADMMRKYNKFSKRLKDFIKEKAPGIHEVVTGEKVESKPTKKEEPKKEPKKEEPKKEEPKKTDDKKTKLSKQYLEFDIKPFNKNPSIGSYLSLMNNLSKSDFNPLRIIQKINKSEYVKFIKNEKEIKQQIKKEKQDKIKSEKDLKKMNLEFRKQQVKKEGSKKFFYTPKKIEDAKSDIDKSENFYKYIAKLIRKFNKSPNEELENEIEYYFDAIRKSEKTDKWLEMDSFTNDSEWGKGDYVKIYKKYLSLKKSDRKERSDKGGKHGKQGLTKQLIDKYKSLINEFNKNPTKKLFDEIVNFEKKYDSDDDPLRNYIPNRTYKKYSDLSEEYI